MFALLLLCRTRGSARCDFPGGSAEQLYDSIQRILALPDETRLYMCHDYGPGGREISWETTVRDERTEVRVAALVDAVRTREREAAVPARDVRFISILLW